MVKTVIWKDMETGGAELCHLSLQEGKHILEGTVVTAIEGVPLLIDYRITVDAQWKTRAVRVRQTASGETSELLLTSDGEGTWTRKGQAIPDLEGCVDVDLEVTPATNMLPIRRLGLDVEEQAEIAAAWVRFPGLTLVRSEQRYERLSERTYRYSSGQFKATLSVDEVGLVDDYEGIWSRLAEAPSRSSQE